MLLAWEFLRLPLPILSFVANIEEKKNNANNNLHVE